KETLKTLLPFKFSNEVADEENNESLNIMNTGGIFDGNYRFSDSSGCSKGGSKAGCCR
ncbi:hypothetical protein A2U01_0043871, partial [Trifolium medium]|nr:hypothetical protein [Trifolium medium]